ncbi:hypothetical protein [Magnetovibrio sp.]|uniref:hypothetical protein n=1 Tax=Magnetovibrio sp. TaxID=2024836 RepID=UPI002F92ED2E
MGSANLDSIAITNHNTFDVKQYVKIKNELGITVYPGIEINLDTGHLLLIANGDDPYEFHEQCAVVESLIPNPTDSISVADLQREFGDLSNFILIPHYDKKPSIPKHVIEELSDFITAGEVMSPKKFMYSIKDAERLVPVYFSDSRMSQELNIIPTRQTYLACDDTNFSSIKNCLRDKAKVSLSPEEGSYLFEVFANGQRLSTGLNVVVGERSSGKSYTLDKIYREANVDVKYIKQFSLVARNSEEDERKFDKILSAKHSLLTREYLEELQHVVNDIIDVDIEADLRSVSSYVASLVKFASESERRDAFSNAKLFSEEKFQVSDQSSLVKLIDSTKHLMRNDEFRSIIDKHVSVETLKKLLVELMMEFTTREEGRLKRIWLNEIIGSVKEKLQIKTSATPIEEIDLYNIAMNMNKVSKFEEVVNLARVEREIKRTSTKDFAVVAKALKFSGAGELKKLSGRQVAFRDAYTVYESPYKFLQELKEIDGLAKADLYKYFANIEYKVLNRDGAEASGGERSEFNLLHVIQDALQYDMLLIDEPESSFDNIFLKSEVNEMIKDISKTMPVVLVTHNSTVGASILPDYLLCTKKEIEDGKPIYRVYSGDPMGKKLTSVDGAELDTFNVTMGCLEAGTEAYEERRKGYENLKN